MQTTTDAALLEAFTSCRDEMAFGELMKRHGALVYRACHRMLGDPHEAEDATQAVFVVLARKAGGLRKADLSAWLYRVAHHVAAEAVRKRMRRTRREEDYADRESVRAEEGPGDVADPAVLQAVDAELMSLPARYREAVILRHLKNHSQEDAARLAGCSVGALAVRAHRGIEQLRKRLGKLGLATSASALVGVLASEASVAVPETLLPSILATVKLSAATTAAATALPGVALGAKTGASSGLPFVAVSAKEGALALAKGAMQIMFWNQVKVAALVAIGAALVGGIGTVAVSRALVTEEPSNAQEEGRAMKTDIPIQESTGIFWGETVNGLQAGLKVLGGESLVRQRRMHRFVSELSAAIRAGQPLLRSLRAISARETDVEMKAAIRELEDRIVAGDPLGEAMKRQPAIFDSAIIHEIQIGETKGELDLALDRLTARLGKVVASDKGAIVEGGPILLEVTVRNAGGQRVTLLDGACSWEWRPRFVSLPGGQSYSRWHSVVKHDESQDLVLSGVTNEGTVTVEASQFILDGGTPAFGLPSGRYKVAVSYAYAGEADAGNHPAYWKGRLTTGELPVEIKPRTDDVHGGETDKKTQASSVRDYILTVLKQAAQDQAIEVIVGRVSDNELPIRYKVKDRWLDLSPAPSRIRAEVMLELGRLAGTTEGRFPQEGMIDTVFSGSRLRWRLILESVDAECRLVRLPLDADETVADEFGRTLARIAALSADQKRNATEAGQGQMAELLAQFARLSKTEALTHPLRRTWLAGALAFLAEAGIQPSSEVVGKMDAVFGQLDNKDTQVDVGVDGGQLSLKLSDNVMSALVGVERLLADKDQKKLEALISMKPLTP